jgi:AcrR family transcriptional regulator
MSIGLRERKKLKTRAAIQKEAMRLFLEKGYEATTIEEIAAAVDISPSTFFNYFPNKEDVVFADELDPLLIEAINAEPSDVNPIRALRNAMRSVFSKLTPEQDTVMRQRMRLMTSSPELRAAMLNQFASQVDQVAGVLAQRIGGKADDFAVRNLAGALTGVMISALLAAADDPKADLYLLADRAMAHLEAGLPLEWHEGTAR